MEKVRGLPMVHDYRAGYSRSSLRFGVNEWNWSNALIHYLHRIKGLECVKLRRISYDVHLFQN